MAAIDALDVLGVSALAKRGVIKASEQGLKFLDNLIQSGASKEDIAKQFVERFPQDANNVGLSYYKSFSDENPRVVFQKDDGSGSGYKPGIQFEKVNLQAREARQKRIDDLNKALAETPLDKPIAFRQMLRKLKIGTDDTKVLEDYINQNPDSLIAKNTLPKQKARKDQLTEEALGILQEEADLLGRPVNFIQAEELTGIPRTNLKRLLYKDKVEGLDKLIGPRETIGDAGTFFKSYIPGANRSSTLDAQVEALVFRDMYRSGECGGR